MPGPIAENNDTAIPSPRFTEALELLMGKGRQRLRVCLPATVISFDAANRTCDCKLVIKELDGSDLPPVLDVPVQYPTGGGFDVTFPLSAGDAVLLHFADRDFEEWYITGQAGPPRTGRRNTMSDAFAVPGLKDRTSSTKAVGSDLTLSHTSGVQIRITSAGKVAIENSSTELLDVLDQLITLLLTATTLVSGSPTPLSISLPGGASALDALQASLASLKE